METLSSELKLKVLENLDFPGLKALVQASPSYYAIYKTFCSQILTSITLSHLKDKSGIVDKPARYLESEWGFGCSHSPCVKVCVHGSKPGKKRLQAAVTEYYIQLEQSKANSGRMRLSVKHCITLLAARALIVYNAVPDSAGWRPSSPKITPELHLSQRAGKRWCGRPARNDTRVKNAHHKFTLIHPALHNGRI